MWRKVVYSLHIYSFCDYVSFDYEIFTMCCWISLYIRVAHKLPSPPPSPNLKYGNCLLLKPNGVRHELLKFKIMRGLGGCGGSLVGQTLRIECRMVNVKVGIALWPMGDFCNFPALVERTFQRLLNCKNGIFWIKIVVNVLLEMIGCFGHSGSIN